MMRWAIVCLVLAGHAVSAAAELQNVMVGGDIRLRGRYWVNTYANGGGGPRELRLPPSLLPGRAIGPFGMDSRYDWDNRRHDFDLIEQKTRLYVDALLSGGVEAQITLESFDVWSRDFRSNYLTGADTPAASVDDLEVLYAYVDVKDAFGTPFDVRIGRQDLKLGKGWLISDIISACLSLSFDAVKVTYDVEPWRIDAWWAKLAETFALESDGDVDYYGTYATYSGFDAIDLSAYWLWVRDARSLNDTNLVWYLEWLENGVGLDDYDTGQLHTLGIRANGGISGWDYDLEAAWQMGNAAQAGFGFKRFTYGDDDAEYDGWAADLEVGYTFEEVPWQPRLFLGGAYFSGEDHRDLTFWEWLNPFAPPRASLSFNRMFSGVVHSWPLDTGQDLSNFRQVRAGVQAKPHDAVTVHVSMAQFWANEPFDWPRHVTLGHTRVPIAPDLAFWTQESDTDLGYNVYSWLRYDYSGDLFFRLIWERFFTGDGLRDGSFMHRNGLEFSGGSDADDADYFQFEMGLAF